MSDPRPCGQAGSLGCKVYQVPPEDASIATEAAASDVEHAAFAARDLRDQVLIFQYRGKFHAVSNVSQPP